MTTHLQLRVPKLRKYFSFFQTMHLRATIAVDDLRVFDPAEPCFDAPPDDRAHTWRPIGPGGEWGGKQQWAWFRAKAVVPAHWPRHMLELHVSHEARYLGNSENDDYPAGPEGQVFIDGQPAGAIDQQHRAIRFPFQPGHTHDIRAVFFAARCDCRHRLGAFNVQWRDAETDRLYHDLRVLLDVVDRLDAGSPVREKLLRGLDATLKTLNFTEHTRSSFPAAWKRDPGHETFYASVPAAQRVLDEHLAQLKAEHDVPTVVCTGHAHIDLAWLWEIGQTHHKCARTFATQLALLREYDGWVFQQSSPQAYAWVERDTPDLFEQIKAQVAAGRWEADGATWVEMDTNMPAGESLVRQLLYGKRYFQEKFGLDSRMLWLPDVFGYSAALPQLLRLAGVDGFVTSKISWSQFNRFPHDTFRWRGLDGSEVATHFITTPSGQWLTYNAMLTVEDVEKTWTEYRQKDRLIEPLLTFGWGDGGGGPTTEMIETGRRMRDWGAKVGLPTVRFQKAGELLRDIARQADALPVWDGELYLEYHRGTYTSQAWLKRIHRKNEIRLHNLEWLSVLARPLGFTLDKANLDAMWRDLLFVEFHDVLPGSSVRGVYDEVRAMMAALADSAEDMTAAAAQTIAERVDTAGLARPVVLFNTLSWDRSDPVRLPDGSWRDGVTVPAGGWTVIDAGQDDDAPGMLRVSDDGRELENEHWLLRLDERGRIGLLRDKRNGRDVFTTERPGNAWQVFEDRSLSFEAWDIDHFYEDHPLPGPALASLHVVETVPARVAVELHWTMPLIGKGPASTITQRIALYRDHPRIDFETRAEWYDHHTLLKAAFPTDIRARAAACEIQFGHLHRPTHRNTSWDFAKFEVCAHRWVDLSEHGYGLALLNDCKYGHDIRDGQIRLTCLMSPQAPNGTADRGEHVFTYALLPHAGSLQDAEVIRRAAELNNPVLAYDVQAHAGPLPRTSRRVVSDHPAVVIDTLKPAEDGGSGGEDVIVRVYESHGGRARATLTFDPAPARVELVDLLERPWTAESARRAGRDPAAAALEHHGSRITLTLRPFDVLTLRLGF